MFRRGYGRGFCHSQNFTPKGYNYIGHCRCGTGPNAYYQDSNGRIIHFREIENRGYEEREDLITEIEILKKEKEEIGKRIEEIEKKLKEKDKKDDL